MAKNIFLLSIFLSITIPFQKVTGQEQVLGLEQAKSMAMTQNNKVKRADQTIKAAEAAKAAVYASNKPKVDANLIGLHVGAPLDVLLPGFNANASLGVSQLIYAGGKINTAKKLSNTSVNLYSNEKELTESEILLEVETTYWQIVNLKGKVELATKYISLLTELLKDLTNSYDAGIIYKNDVLLVQVQLNQAELDLTKANDGLTLSKLKMTQLIGREDTDFAIEDSISVEKNLVEERSPSIAIEDRPEIKILKNAVELKELETKILKADQRPTVALNINGIHAVGENINFSDRSDGLTSYFGLLNVSIPIFDWGGRKQKVKEQQRKMEAQKLELEETKELLSIEIQNVYLEWQQAIKKVDISEKSLVQAEENLRLYQDRFEAGTVVGKDVLEAQVLWQKAYSDIIDAKAGYRITEANYKKVVGTLN
ncbi:TolC family protein [Muricauda sp. SCSIO 64092]|uniref:TolC family protein n=1 Tax=Allomuricauda sp. SCSIO 64092 TaxID=2908842 RepID=UPI001FF16BA1|nr:TolC family protein [Muricauda sp. SCSIO 64092]UOY08283.1 TolC family protein [Muricauda sp. SCSIO 64092]